MCVILWTLPPPYLKVEREAHREPLNHAGQGQFGGDGMSVHAKLTYLKEAIRDVKKMAQMLSAYFNEFVACQSSFNADMAVAQAQLQAAQASSFDGTFVWRIPDISRKRRGARSGRVSSIDSPPFYTGRRGYKLCIRVYLNGVGTGEDTHLSLFIVIMKWDYDPLLVWPFDHKVSKTPPQLHLVWCVLNPCPWDVMKYLLPS